MGTNTGNGPAEWPGAYTTSRASPGASPTSVASPAPSTVALSALGYARPGTRIIGGRVFLGDVDVLELSPRQRRELRGKDVAYVAQSAQASLNPAIPIGEQVGEDGGGAEEEGGGAQCGVKDGDAGGRRSMIRKGLGGACASARPASEPGGRKRSSPER